MNDSANTQSKRHVLIVEDEAKIAALLHDYLHAAGYRCSRCGDGAAALLQFAAQPPDLVLLDLMLPGLDGLEVCRAIRRHAGPAAAVPIIMVTARVEEVDRLIGLEMGADDYLCKPFSPREVVARVRALLRRADGHWSRDRVARQGLVLDEAGQRANWWGQTLPLTPVEYRLLRTMMAAPGRIFSRAQLLDAMHGDFRDVSDRAVDSHVKNLRKKLAAVISPHECIASVYGVGYRFEPPDIATTP